MNTTSPADDSSLTGEHPTVTEMFGWIMVFFSESESEADKRYPGVKRHFFCFHSQCRDHARTALGCTEGHKDHPSMSENYEQRRAVLLSRYWL